MEFSTESMTYSKQGQRLVTEISDHGASQLQAQIKVKSHKTGKVVKFVYDKTVKDSEGDVQYWNYRPVQVVPGVTELMIIND